MALLDGKNILITGVLTDDSLAFGIAKQSIDHGANIVLTGAGRGLSLTKRTARKLSADVEVLELDVTNQDQYTNVVDQLQSKWTQLDGLIHAIGFAPENCLGGDIMKASWPEVATAIEISAYSLKSLCQAFLPLLEKSPSASVVGLDFDARFAWPAYDWMGIAKASLESLSRYLARDLGKKNIRVNLVAAGPIRTMAAKSIPGFAEFEQAWNTRAPLNWDVRDSSAVASACVALLSDLFPMTTGELIHVDGGYHAIGA